MIKSPALQLILILSLFVSVGIATYNYGYNKGKIQIESDEYGLYMAGFEDGRKDANEEAGRIAALYVNDQWELYIKHYCWDIDKKVEASLLPKDSQEDSTLKMCLWKKGDK